MIATTEEQRLLEKWQKKLCREERGLQLGRRGVDCDGSTRSWEQGGYQRRLVVR